MKNCSNFKPAMIIPMVIGGVLIGGLLAFLFGFVVMWLWNWLMPDIFGLTTITYWQAWGLVVLSHILFKLGAFPHHHKHHDKDRNFKNHFASRCKPEPEKPGDGPGETEAV